METNNFFELLRSFTQMAPSQLARAQEHLHHHLQQDLLLQALTEHHSAPPICPHCPAQHVIHWGQSRGLLLYRCKACSKTFNQLHGAALVRLRNKDKWACYARCLSEGMSLRKTARECHIDLKTSFRWRHRFLRYALTTGASKLGGIVEADEIFTAESFKDSRKHGRRGHGHVPLVTALIALDRYENEADACWMRAIGRLRQRYSRC